jgi:hypothetical protein
MLPLPDRVRPCIFGVLLLGITIGTCSATDPEKDPAGGGKVFIINNCITDLSEFQKLLTLAERLKPYGRVQINISTLAEKGFYEIPRERSPWHDYASNNSTPYKFFPDAKILPFVPAAFVARNRQLILAKAKMLRAHGMEGAFFGSEPNMLPDAFFDAHPEMLGPRVDHPRRSNHQAFAPCFSVKETQEMYRAMMADMLKNVPEIKTFYFKTNDAGAGICWAQWLYTGPNGPSLCEHESMGTRVLELMNVFTTGAEKAGTSLDIYLSEPQGSSNFSDEERKDIQTHLPKNCFFQSTDSNEMISLNTAIGSNYPVTGIFDPIAFAGSLQSIQPHRRQTVFINFRSWYSKGNENIDAMKASVDMLEHYLHGLVAGTGVSGEGQVRELCEAWVGIHEAPALYTAFSEMHDAFEFKDGLGNILPINWNVAARMVNRPLVVAPQRLSKEEEAYFLPFVFNVSEEEARMDYTDIQGARRTTRPDSVKAYVSKIADVCSALESIDKSAPGFQVLHQMALALRINASFARSCGNFAVAQALRDKNASKLKGPIHRPDKTPTWEGDPDLLKFNEVMRDELDNAQELEALLSRGGIRIVCHAKDAVHEDTFLLGPDLIAQLKKKRRVMLNHWRDIEDYMTTPFK